MTAIEDAVPAVSDRLSRWTLLIFACALVNFLLAQALIVAGVTWPEAALTAGSTLVAVHLITLGWLTLLMFGALLQFVPVITTKPLLNQWLSFAVLVLVELGLAGMVIGFLAFDHDASGLTHCLPFGGTLVLAGVLLAMVNIVTPLIRSRPLALPGRFVLAGLTFLLVTVLLGLTFALALSVPAFTPLVAPLLAGGIGYHVLAGLGGWFTLTAMGVSYKLLSMFMLAPEERGWWGECVLQFGISGFGLSVSAGLLSVWRPRAVLLNIVQYLGWLAIAVAVMTYLIDVLRLYRTRKRARIELHNRAAFGAFLSLAAALVIAVVLVASHRLAAYAPALVLLVLFGWLSGLGLTQLYKIVPFLTWITRYGHQLGRGAVPRVQDLVDEARTSPWFVIYFLGVALATLGAFINVAYVCRTGVAVSAGATLGLTFEYWRAWRGHYAGRARPAAPIPPPCLSGGGPAP